MSSRQTVSKIAFLEVVGGEALAVEIDADHPRRQIAGIFDRGHAQGVDALDAGQSANPLDRLGRYPQVGAARHLGGSGDVEVADQRALEPDLDRLAEAADHHRNADRDRHRERQGGDGDAGAGERSGDGPGAHPPEEADPPPGGRGDRAHGRRERQRHAERAADQHEEESTERQRQRARREAR